MATKVLDATAPTGAVRRPPWRSPQGEPEYARPALLLLVVLAAVLYVWGIERSEYHTFYASAVRSMTESWKAFFYGSFDPGNSITLDKLPGFLWPQALSARLFGFHPWSLSLPQALEGVASLLVLHRVVRRWAGVHAALIAGAAFLVTPVAVGLFRTSVEDPAFTLCLLLAAEATQRAAVAGRLRPLVMAGVWVGVGFQAKMLEAWVVLPALALVYLISAPLALRRRLVHLGVSALVMTAVSVSWMLAVTLTPAKDRPYVDGTTNNSVFSMVVGYNFLTRFSSLGISAASTGSISATQGGGGGHGAAGAGQGTGRGFGGAAGPAAGTGTGGLGSRGAGAFGGAGAYGRGRAFGAGGGQGAGPVRGTRGSTAAGAPAARSQAVGGFGDDQNGWSKMFGASLASQTGWFYPIAALAAVCGLLWCRGRPRTDRLRAGYVLWTTWLALYFLVFSAGSVAGHTYYMGVVAVPLAALTGAGTVLMWRAYRTGGPRAWALPGAVAATAAWAAYLAGQFPAFRPGLVPAVAVLGLAAVVLLVLARPGRPRAGGRLALAGLAASLAALLVAPSAWAVQVFAPSYRTNTMGAVGPAGANRGQGAARSGSGRFGRTAWAGGAMPGRMGQGGLRGMERGGAGGFGGAAPGGALTAAQRRLLDYTRAHQGSAAYVFATSSWSTAAPYILATGADVLPIGGFSGRVPYPTEARFRQLVDAGTVRYVLLGGGRGMGAMAQGTGPAAARTAQTGTDRTATGQTAAAQITAWVQAACTPVPASAYGGTDSAVVPSLPGRAGNTAAAQVLYRCGPGQ
ncbi:glycosyltransferase family 39 protein [Streptomyces sp. FXJ1.172]|uniref:ArnT family glycosyltransferase n=1 Tax=Streptomyces sp. FXJ1.172 TaxID=710705 RepID=UPI0007D01F8E|nr:glycosyltransferase family 39 protein [Streptomyces sp. FXJ1.172]WEO93830.1 glycosyltransferase family 39 protein [Streptomyces sp. FXJ1.172]